MASTVLSWHSLKTRITLATLGIFLAGIWSLSFYASQMLRQDMERLLGEQQFATVSMVAAQVNRELEERLEALKKVARLSGRTLQAGASAMQARLEQRADLQALFSVGTFVTRIDGLSIAFVPFSERRIGVNYSDRDYLVSALSEGKASIGRPVMGRTTPAPVLVMAAPIHDAQDKVIGALAGSINLAIPNFLDQITESRYGKTGGYLLVAPQHRVIVTATDKSRIMETLPATGINPLIDRFSQGYEGSGVVINPLGVEVLASAKGIPVAAWYAVATLPTAEAFAPIRDLQQRMLLATLLLTLLAGGLTWWMLRRQLSPLLLTAKTLAAMSDTNPPWQPLPIVRQDEIGLLIGGFNRLIETVRQSQIALRQREHYQRALLDNFPFLVWLKDQDSRFLAVNQPLAKACGYASPKLLAGKTDLDLWPRDLAEAYRADDRAVLDSGKPKIVEEALEVDGQRVWFETYKSPVTVDGQIIGTVGFARDVSERKQAEAKLRESEALLQTLIHAIPDLVWLKNPEGVFLACNQSFERSLGASEKDIVGKTDYDFAEKELADFFREHDRIAMAKGAPSVNEEWITFADDGHRGLLETTKTPIFDVHGRLIGVLGIGHDITERKEAEEALRESEARLGMALEATHIGIWDWDIKRDLWYASPTYFTMLGYEPEAGVSDRAVWLNRIHPDDRQKVANKISDILRGSDIPYQYEARMRHADGAYRWIAVLGKAVERDENGSARRLRGVRMDITERKQAEEEIRHLAFYDQLTGLPNRRLLVDRLEQALAIRSRHPREGALLFIDLDNFKTLNDTLGHDQGDQLLQQVAQRLVACVREGDTVARLGGDEFVVMLEDLSENAQEAATQAETVGEKILVTLDQTYPLSACAYHSTASIGIALFADRQEIVDELLKRADLAMYQAKAAGRNTLRFFDPDMQAVVTARAALEAGLREAVLKQQFLLYYQAQVDSSGRVIGAEALLRWAHPERGLVSPGEFIPLAEDTGLILPLGHWVLETACTQLAAWAARPEMAQLTLAVNVSARQFHHGDFVEQVLAALGRSAANPQRLKLELTESLLISNIEDIISKMTALKAQGVGFSLDDFGTGYSSLSYLKRLPLDQLKIDQSFVRDILVDPNDAAIARMVIALAESLGLAVIAEGVESEAQRDFLARQGCHAYQGYLFCRPLPLDEFEEFVHRA